jgi:outer membrane protein assembly factor BamB
VVVPAAGGPELVALACEGRFVVHGLAPAGAVDAIRAALPASLGGLVSVQAWKAWANLPYADHLVDLVVVDRDVLGANGPTDAELLRVVAPAQGAVWQKKGGAWSKLTKPMPQEYGEWTHYFHDATNNPVSNDTAVKAPTSMQWLADSPADVQSQNQLIAGGRYVGLFGVRAVTTEVRNAFNGIALRRSDPVADPANNQRYGPTVLMDGLLYTTLDGASAKPRVVALDPVSATIVRTFELPLPDLSKKPGDRRSNSKGRYLGLSACEDVLMVWTLDKLFCVERATGKLRWTFDGKGRNVDYPAYDPKNHRVGLLIAEDGLTFVKGDRDQRFWATEIVSLSLKDGSVAWRVPHPLASVAKPEPGASFLWSNGAFYFNTNITLGNSVLDVGAIDADTGRVRWFKAGMTEYGGGKIGAGSGVGSLLAYPDAVVLTRSAMLAFNPRTGDSLGEWILGNSRCDTGRGAANCFGNFGHYFRVDGTSFSLQRNEVGRGPCGGNALPAYGMHYFQPQTCQCYAAVRGLFATSSQPVADPVADDGRLEKGPAFPLKPARTEGAGDWPALMHDSARSCGGSALKSPNPKELWRIQLEPNTQPGPIAADWRECANFNGPISMPVSAGGLVLVAAPDAHRVHAVDASTGRKAWTFTADARVDTPPTVSGGRVYFGSRDGYVYCLDLATGGLCWRFLAARNPKQMVAYGQVESAWPVHGSVVVEKGLVLATAGYHPDMDGGIQCWGLEAATGAVRWKRILAAERAPLALDPAKSKMPFGYFVPNLVLNTVPNSDGAVAVLPGAVLSLTDGSGEAQLGGLQVGKGKVPSSPEITHGLMITDWKNSPPYHRSKDGDYSGPGNPDQKQNILVAGGTPALVKGSWARRAAWDAHRFAHLNSNSPDLLVFDRQSPITVSWGGRGRDAEPLAEEIAKTGKVLARAILNSGKEFRSATDRERVALILAGDQAVVATVATGKDADPHLRPKATIQIADLKTGSIASSFETKPGVIENGMATAQGRLFMSLDDGSLVAWE